MLGICGLLGSDGVATLGVLTAGGVMAGSCGGVTLGVVTEGGTTEGTLTEGTCGICGTGGTTSRAGAVRLGRITAGNVGVAMPGNGVFIP